jgi:hypothetical protein
LTNTQVDKGAEARTLTLQGTTVGTDVGGDQVKMTNSKVAGQVEVSQAITATGSTVDGPLIVGDRFPDGLSDDMKGRPPRPDGPAVTLFQSHVNGPILLLDDNATMQADAGSTHGQVFTGAAARAELEKLTH